MKNPISENTYFDTILNSTPQEIKQKFVLKEISLDKGNVFFDFDMVGEEQYDGITATYNMNKQVFTQIDLSYHGFGRPAGYNNYPKLKDVIQYIIANA